MRLRLSRSRRRAYGFACIALLGLASVLLWPSAAWLQAAGMPTPGHANLECAACHQPAAGTLRQQVQASVRYFLGLRVEPAAIGNAPVQDSACRECHQRTADRHSLAVLSETRFVEVQAAHGVHHCTGCHQEHHGQRVTASAEICSNCHADISIKGDTAVPDHATLLAQEAWDTCMRCHDYHGNHDLSRGESKYPTRFADGFTLEAVREYLGSGDPVYGPKIVPTKQQGDLR